MPSLRELQLEFMRYLFAHEDRRAPGFIRETDREPERGFAAYRNNVYGNLRHTLRSVYPVVERLVGNDFFGFAASAYIDGQASCSGDLNQYGGEFPAFLLAFPPAQGLPYLADVAALEWACHVTHDAAEISPRESRGLAATAAEDYGRLVVTMHPSVTLLRSRYPILAIWEKNQANYAGDPSVDLRQGGDNLLIRRTQGSIDIEALPAVEWTFLSLLAQGTCLQETFDRLPGSEDTFDLAATLRRHCDSGVLVDFTLPPPVLQE